MQQKPLWIAISTISILSTLLTSCAVAQWAGLGGASPRGSVPSGKLTSSGFNCPEPNPRMQVSSTELDLYVWSTYVPTDFFECFRLVYGVEVKSVEYSSMEEMRAGLEERAGGYDLIQPTDFGVPSLIDDGLLAMLDHSRLPILSNFNAHYLNLPYDPGNQYTIPYESGTDAIAVNTAAVKDMPNSWTDLWRPEYAGRFALADDERTVIGFTLLTLGYDVNTSNPSELEQARRALLVLQPGIKVFDSDSPSTRLLDGEIDLAETWTGEAFLAQQQDPAMEYVYPTEGPILWQDNWAMLAQAPHSDAAYAWLNYTMQGDMFWMMLTNFPYSNPNEAALAYAKDNPMQVTDVNGETTTLRAVYDTYMKSSITNPPADVIRQGHRISDVGEAISMYDAIWAEIRGSE
jgi:spermidine/putrescine transport system substrate-binding protein